MQADLEFRKSGEGRGYYRNISLLSLWQSAPFGHGNYIGTEVCNTPSKPEYDTFVSPYGDANGNFPNERKCMPIEEVATIVGRLKAFDESMDELLTEPSKRKPKEIRTSEIAYYTILERFVISKLFKPMSLKMKFRKGTSVALLGSFRHKEFARDFAEYLRNKKEFEAMAQKKFPGNANEVLAAFHAAKASITPNDLIGTIKEAVGIITRPNMEIDLEPAPRDVILKAYTNCGETIENMGHEFGTGMSEKEQRALKAFLLTL